MTTDISFSEQEHKRTQESSHVDDRTEHGIYVHPFMRSVQACVASVMCSYSKRRRFGFLRFALNLAYLDLINDTYACENDKTLNGILKGEFGFQGC